MPVTFQFWHGHRDDENGKQDGACQRQNNNGQNAIDEAGEEHYETEQIDQRCRRNATINRLDLVFRHCLEITFPAANPGDPRAVNQACRCRDETKHAAQ